MRGNDKQQEDLNLTDDKKGVLRKLPSERKWLMLFQHLGDRYRAGPQEVLQEIQEIQKLREGADKELLTNLVVSLRSRPIRWISGFIDHGGFAVLLDNLNELEMGDVYVFFSPSWLENVVDYSLFYIGTMNMKNYILNV